MAKPFKDNTAKQERFERFIKEKYQGGLRSTASGGSSNMSEASRARERLDFEAATEEIEKAKLSKEIVLSDQLSKQLSAIGGMQFTSGGLEPTPAPRMRCKIDTLIFIADTVKATKIEETFSANRDVLPVSRNIAPGISKEEAENDNKVKNVERPVDLYKVRY